MGGDGLVGKVRLEPVDATAGEILYALLSVVWYQLVTVGLARSGGSGIPTKTSLLCIQSWREVLLLVSDVLRTSSLSRALFPFYWCL